MTINDTMTAFFDIDRQTAIFRSRMNASPKKHRTFTDFPAAPAVLNGEPEFLLVNPKRNITNDPR
jgi:hypothetical protein